MSLIDIAIPSYQYGHLLKGCVESILTQGVDELRILIIDNASSDNSVEIARGLSAQDPRVHVVARQTNLGAHASFNEGIDWASGKYFLLLCADDLLAPGALRRAISVMEQRPDVHLTYGAVVSLPAGEPVPPLCDTGGDGQWRVMPGVELLNIFCSTGRNHVPGPTAVVRTSVQKKIGHYREELQNTTDFEMWMRFASHGNVAETAQVQGIARTHLDNLSALVANIHVWSTKFEAAFASFFAHEGILLPEAPHMLRKAHRSLAERAYCSAFSHLCRGEVRVAKDLLNFVWQTSPAMVVIPPIGYLRRRADASDKIIGALRDASGRVLKV